ncbi:MAG: 5-formyltetrahydrofolate cyclo-ligase [Acidobacteria bacterium]|nr:5-formyltetrahydrofolate cyclo-ligase [Acidobacteriota bacterium]
MNRQLDAADATTRRTASAEVRERVLDLPEIGNAEGVLACLSFGSEVDTWPLVDQLRRRGKSVFVPRADRHDGMLHVHPLPCELRTLSFGLRQPARGAAEIPYDEIEQVVDVVLVLGLAFDRQGYRLGHGRGYFDRFLTGRTVTSLGLCYSLQLLESIPHDEVDVPMSAIVTSSEVARPEGPEP